MYGTNQSMETVCYSGRNNDRLSPWRRDISEWNTLKCLSSKVITDRYSDHCVIRVTQMRVGRLFKNFITDKLRTKYKRRNDAIIFKSFVSSLFPFNCITERKHADISIYSKPFSRLTL